MPRRTILNENSSLASIWQGQTKNLFYMLPRLSRLRVRLFLEDGRVGNPPYG
ncbi:MAG: hypothetical protein Fur0021_20310 [Candidatus Promineifilaceae bacterium]